MPGWDVTINVATSNEALALNVEEGKWYMRLNNASGATVREEWTSTMASAFFWDNLTGGQTYTVTAYRTNSTTSNSQTSIQSVPVIRTFTLATDTPPEPPDTTPPSVIFASPATGSTQSGTIVWVVNVRDDFDTIATQLLTVDGHYVNYVQPFDTRTLTNAVHVATMYATDASGNASSGTMTFNVFNAATPVTNTQPFRAIILGASLSGALRVALWATVPTAFQSAYAFGKPSIWTGANATENAAIASGQTAEKIILVPQVHKTVVEIENEIQDQWNEYNDKIQALDDVDLTDYTWDGDEWEDQTP